MTFAEWWRRVRLPEKLKTDQMELIRQVALKAYNAGKKEGKIENNK